jgi:hypothetical protein
MDGPTPGMDARGFFVPTLLKKMKTLDLVRITDTHGHLTGKAGSVTYQALTEDEYDNLSVMQSGYSHIGKDFAFEYVEEVQIPSWPESDEEVEHREWLDRAKGDGLATENAHAAAHRLWDELFRMGLSTPAACTGPNGEVFYCWDKSEHHLEFEVFGNGAVVGFYRNRLTGEIDRCGFDFQHPITPNFTRHIQQIKEHP